MTRDPGALDQRLHSAFEWILERLPSHLGATIRERAGGRFGIGSQIVVGLGGGVTLTIGAIILCLGLMIFLSGRQAEVTEEHMPALVGAFEVAQQSAELIRATPRMLAAANPAELDSVRLDVARMERSLTAAVEAVTLVDEGAAEDVARVVAPLVDSLLESVDRIHESVVRRMAIQASLDTLEERLSLANLNLQLLVEQEIDDQHFFMFTGLRELGDRPAPLADRRTDSELNQYQGLLAFKAYQNEVAALIAQAMTEGDPLVLRANRERAETALSDVVGALASVRPRARAELERLLGELQDLYGSPTGVYETRLAEIAEGAAAEGLVARNRGTTAELVTRVEGLVGGAEEAARSAARRSSALVQLGFWFVLGVTVLTVAAAYVAWKFFGERMLVRIGELSRATRRMSKGDLEVQVSIEGNDELTDMAGALEVFRRHAVEVQRLNLVEKLAAEVQAKNATLEDALENLRRTQQQVVNQEKLASLGQLTAGIAHEIRNPLNFVNNFAELSSELIAELREEMAGMADGGDGEVDLEFVGELLDDLDTNVVKVNEHGTRANRIVEGMLAHSRDEAGSVEPIDVNVMAQEYAKLAYHGIRGTDSSFNVDMVYELDPEAGEVEGVARDLSRVLLNVVTNACHATHKRRLESDSSYLPTVTVVTEDRGHRVRVRVRDNGTGIPDDVVGKIFDPFFTTKSGTEGTGLGLSISHEIVQAHQGTLEVESEPGEFTEFAITLPRKSYETVAAS